ncbi:phosphate:sodium symporter [Sphingobacteriales bacterium UPWRP_1]|nr:hypothetical protein B6N25_03765 [Sphingobacteriales bacterium TSM_CSS]PSJ76640.1 phosphate:sodium symporter [Sphingobacteriales bacterium UPWRP_1]
MPMPDYYLLIVVLLLLFAIGDLIVGVSNDAVNFLNSAIGSKAAPRKVIMWVASIGIFAGAAFSGGMMEVARKGIFNPSFFVFAEVMIIFVAVMLTDIVLLDVFNTFGLPTSTTVSLVFELLGASVAIGLVKIIQNGHSLALLANYINASNVTSIVSGIFLSVLFAFVFGAVVQYFSRLLFTFNFKYKLPAAAIIWSGAALSVMTYFLFIKGIKGAAFISADFAVLVNSNAGLLIGCSFAGWVLLLTVMHLFAINVLRVVVLFGTFSLAMAFAGNDLVNFIGVPMAGYEAWRSWLASGADANVYNMQVLSGAVKPNTIFLTLAGLVMTFTLWFSRKARTVTNTEVSLGRQEEGIEKFEPNILARMLVRLSWFTGVRAKQLIPASWFNKAEARFTPPQSDAQTANNGINAPAFDLVRASVNLTVASALIALGTSYKLPLSTTYVTFIVAMASSLADGAWGRDSAVYRVSGVLHVIGGWFATALIAFSVSAIFAVLIYQLGGWALAALILLAAGLIAGSFLHHQTRETENERIQQLLANNNSLKDKELARDTALSIANTLATVKQAYQLALEGLKTESETQLKKTKKIVKTLKQQNKEFKVKLLHALQRIEEEDAEAGSVFLLVYDLEQDISQSIMHIIKSCREHVENMHTPLQAQQIQQLEYLQELLNNYLLLIIEGFKNYNFNTLQQVLQQKQALFENLENMLALQINGIKQHQYNATNSHLFFNILLETKDIIAVAARFMKLYNRLHLAYDNPQQKHRLIAQTTTKG